MLTKFLIAGLFVLFAGLGAAFYIIFTDEPSEERKQSEFLERLASPDAQSELKALFQEQFDTLVFDGKHEGPSFIAKLTGTDLKAKVSEAVRPISTDLELRMTVRDFLLKTGAVGAFNEKRARGAAVSARENALKDGTAEEAAAKKANEAYESHPDLSIDDVMSEFREEVFALFPPQFVQMMNISPDGTSFVMPGWPALGGGISEAPVTAGILGPEHVGASLSVYGRVCLIVPANFAENFFVTVTLRVNSATEDSWKREVLFEGTAREFCAERAKGEYPKVYKDEGMMVFRRPGTKVFPAPKLILGSVEDLATGGNLYFPSVNDRNVEITTAIFENLEKSPLVQSNIVIMLDKGEFRDAGAPVFYVKADKSEPVRLVGFMNIAGTYALSAAYILQNIEEFPNIVSGEK